MKVYFIALSVAAMMAAGAGSGTALPVNGGLKTAIDDIDLTQQAAVYVVEGRRYCFYFEGWQGPGWYRCGYAWRRGLGWGGAYGWRSWTYAPAERRFGGTGATVRSGSTIRAHEGRRAREGVTVRGTRETTTRGDTTIRGTRENTTRSGATVRGGQSQQPGQGGATTGGGSPRTGGARSGGANAGGSQQMNAGPRGNRGAAGDKQ